MTADRVDTLFFVVIAIAAIVIARKAWQWKASLDRCDVRLKDPTLFRDQVAEERRAILASTLRGPAAKGFDAQIDRHERDRQAHVLALKDPRR